MNCKNFEAVISDLAREQMLEAHTRESALLHVEECKACAGVLADERALTSGLRSLAASMKGWEAPAPVEASLLAKFRERTAAEQSSPVVVQMPQRASSWRRWYPQAVAAAVMLMFAVGGAAMLRMRQGETSVSQPQAAAGNKGGNAPIKATPASTNPGPADTGDIKNPTITNSDKDGQNAEPRQKLSQSEVELIMGTTPRRPAYPAVPRSKINKSGMTSASGEIATDFMPVAYGDNLNDFDNGRIIRVEMPRSALAQFGLPVNMERANERIKADVLIGDDGMARAIRFVR
jgi:hypothetical protein